MDRQILEWRNENACRSYPFKDTNLIEPDFIIDACFFIESPVYLTSIEKVEFGLVIIINDYIKFYYSTLATVPYAYNDFGKIYIGTIPNFTSKKIYNLRFLDSTCYSPKLLQLMEDSGNLTITGETEDNNITISLDETPEFKYNCIQTINGLKPNSRHIQITGDDCTEINMYPNVTAINDICKPPCYNCNERLTSGDVHIVMTDLENRVDALEHGHHEGKYKISTIVYPFDSLTPSTINFNKIYSVLKSATIYIQNPFNSGTGFSLGTSTQPELFVKQSDINISQINTYKYDIYNSGSDLYMYLYGGRTTGIGVLVVELLHKVTYEEDAIEIINIPIPSEEETFLYTVPAGWIVKSAVIKIDTPYEAGTQCVIKAANFLMENLEISVANTYKYDLYYYVVYSQDLYFYKYGTSSIGTGSVIIELIKRNI